MYLALIKYCINTDIDVIDLVGGKVGTFCDVIKHLIAGNRPDWDYKLKLLTLPVRNNPDKQIPYKLHFCKKCRFKTLYDTSSEKIHCYYCLNNKPESKHKKIETKVTKESKHKKIGTKVTKESKHKKK